MLSRNYDGYLWLGLTVFIVVGVRAIGKQLHEIVVLNEHSSHHGAHQERRRNRALGPTEKDIPLSVLNTLSTCPSYDIREAANKIIVDRFLKTYGSANFKQILARIDPPIAEDRIDDADDTAFHYRPDVFRRFRLRRADGTLSEIAPSRLLEISRRLRHRRTVVVGTPDGTGEGGVEEIIIREPAAVGVGEVDGGSIFVEGPGQNGGTDLTEAFRLFEQLQNMGAMEETVGGWNT